MSDQSQEPGMHQEQVQKQDISEEAAAIRKYCDEDCVHRPASINVKECPRKHCPLYKFRW